MNRPPEVRVCPRSAPLAVAHSRRTALIASLIAGALGACVQDQPLAPSDLPRFAISDAVHGQGSAGFYFRPPMVPTVPLPGTFDPALQPEVTICEWNGAECVAIVADFGAGSAAVHDDHYQVDWHAGDYDLDPAKTYRILVSVGGTLLGFADVDVVASGRELKNVNTGEFIPLVEGRTLPIKFYVQRGTVATIGPDGGTFVSADGKVEIEVPAGLLEQPLGITVRSAPLGASEYADAALVPGTTYDFGPDGTVFGAPGVRVTIHYDAANLGAMAPAELTLLTKVDGLWAELANQVVDADAGTVTADLGHFTLVTVGLIQPAIIVEPGPIDLVMNQVIDLTGVVGPNRAVNWSISPLGSPVATVTGVGPGGGRVTAIVPGTVQACLTSKDYFHIVTSDCVTVNVTVPGNGTLRNVSGGFNFACGQDVNGVAYCWGQNAFGQLGDGSTTNRSSPVPVAGNLQFSTVVAGGAHACGLTADGRAWCWGRNNFGQLGDNTLADRAAPVTVMGDWRFALITAGDRHTCGFTRVMPTQSPTLLCWGSNEWGQSGGAIGGAAMKQPFALTVNPAGGLTSLDAGLGHTCAVIDSRATCWGLNANGQLGDNTTSNGTFTFNRVQSMLAFRSISAGPGHTCAVTTSDEGYCWGRNSVVPSTPGLGGQLGDGTTDERHVPTAVSGGRAWQQIDAGGNAGTTCGITTPGSVPPRELYCWGRNLAGNVGDATNADKAMPALVSGGGTYEQVSASGGGHTCATRVDGGGSCWGSNAFGQLGDASTTSRNTPVAVEGFTVVPGRFAGTITGFIRRRFTTIPLATVQVSPTYGLPALTDAQGAYALGPMIPGPTTLKLNFLPVGCLDPGLSTTVPSGQNIIQTIQVDCVDIGSVTLAPAAATLQVGTILSLVDTVRSNQGAVVPVSPTFSASGSIYVSGTGEVTAVAVGTGVVTATAAPAFARSRITVQGGCAAFPTAGCVLTGHLPSLEPYLRSKASSVPTTIEFTNASGGPIQIFWLRFDGTRQLFSPPGGLASGASTGFNTFTTHTWVVADMLGNALGVYANSATTHAKVIHTGALPSYTRVDSIGHPMSAVWGASSTDMWAVGFGAQPLRLQANGTWLPLPVPGTGTTPLTDVWGLAGNDVYAVGWSGRIIHFDGSLWSQEVSGVPTVFLNGVGGTSAKVYAVGSGGTIVSKSGGGPWIIEQSTGVQLQDVWAADPGNVWAVGDGGVILRGDGAGTWTVETLSPPTTRSFRGVWGTSNTDVYAVGQDGVIYHYNGSSWTAEPDVFTTQTLQAVGGTSPTHVVAMGGQGTYLRKTTAGWIPQPVPAQGTLEGIWFATSTDAVIVTSIAATTPQTGSIIRGQP